MGLLQTTIKNFTQNPKNDILSGLTVALALVPEAVAFAFVAGVDPLVGLYGAFMMGLITSLFGGRPGMISGATGAMAVVMVHLIQKGNQVGISLDTPVENLGLKWLFITLLIVGGIQITAGIANHKPQLVGKPSDVERHSIPDDDIVIEIDGEILWRASEDGFPDTQRGPEWVTEILNKVVGTEEVTDDGVVIEPGNEEVVN